MGLAILTKGPVTLALLALAVFIYMLMFGRNPFALVLRGWPWGLAVIAIAIAAAWYVPAFIAGRGAGLGDIFRDENLGHFMPASMGGTGEAARPVYYIAMRLIGGALLLSALLVAVGVAFTRGDFAANVRKPMLYQLALALAVLILFSAASAKRDDYILPALPPLAILFAALFAGGGIASFKDSADYGARVRDWTVTIIAVVMSLGMIAAAVLVWSGRGFGGMTIRLQSSDASYAAIFADGLARGSAPVIAFMAAIAIGVALIFIGLRRRLPLWSGAGLAVMCLTGSVLWTGTLRPAEAVTRSVRDFAAQVRDRVGGAPLYVPWDDPEFAWYYGYGVPALPREIARAGPPAGGAGIFLWRGRRSLCGCHRRCARS